MTDPRARDRTALRIYLSDHRADAAIGLARARNSAHRNRGTAFGNALDAIADQLETDVQSLDRVIEELAVHESAWKRAVGAFAERVGRLKPNGHLLSPAPLSRVLEIELLMAGIDAKRSLWRSLQVSWGADVRSVDLDELVQRAGDQRALLRELHPEAARAAFLGELADARR
jgi:hypothetical protein